MTGRRRRWHMAIAVLGLYMIAVWLTMSASGHHVLPLFEGTGPPPPYQWVKPPPAFAAANVAPGPASQVSAFKSGKTPAFVAATADGQVIINFGAGAFGQNPGDDTVRVAITPLDPATLGPAPTPLKPDGNAYHIEFSYQPSGTPVIGLATPSNLVMSAPLTATSLLYSDDGQKWTAVTSQPVAGPSVVGATITKPGWYLVGTTHNLVSGPKGTSGGDTALIAVVVALVAAGLGGAAVLLGRRRRRRA